MGLHKGAQGACGRMRLLSVAERLDTISIIYIINVPITSTHIA